MRQRRNVEALAALARIALRPEDVPRLQSDLEALMELVETLEAIDVTGVPPLRSVSGVLSVFREDRVLPSLSREQALGGAPESERGFFRVPRVIDRA